MSMTVPPLEANPLAAQALRFAAAHGIAARRHRDFVALEYADGLDEEKFTFAGDGFASLDASGSTSDELRQALEGFLALADARRRVLRGLDRRILETGGSIEKSPVHWCITTRTGCLPQLDLGYRLTDRIRQDGAESTLADLLANPWTDGEATEDRFHELLEDEFTPQEPPPPPSHPARPGGNVAAAIKMAYLPGIETLDLPDEARKALEQIDEIADEFVQEWEGAAKDPWPGWTSDTTQELQDEIEPLFDAFQSTIDLPGAGELPRPSAEELERADRWTAAHIVGMREHPNFTLRRIPSTYIEGLDWYLSEEDWLRHARGLVEKNLWAWGSAEGAFLLEKEPKPERYAAARSWAQSFLDEGAYDAEGFDTTLILLRPEMPELEEITKEFLQPRQLLMAWRAGLQRVEKVIRDQVLRADDLLHNLDSLSTASAVDLARLFSPAELARLRERCRRWARECDELGLKLHHRDVAEIALRMEWFEIFEILRTHPRFGHILWTIGESSSIVLRHVRKTLRAFLRHLETQGFRDLEFARRLIERLEKTAESNLKNSFQEEDLLQWTAIPDPPPDVAAVIARAILEAEAGQPPSSLLHNHDYLAIAWSRLRRAETQALMPSN